MVTITTAKGKDYSELKEIKKIKVPRTENTELFYRILEAYVPQETAIK